MLPALTSLAVAVAATVAVGGGPWRTAATQPPGLKIVVVSGEDAVNIIQQKTAVAPVVEVRDRNDLPIAGVPVTFTVGGGGNTAAFAGGAQTMTVTTNAAGRAAVSGLTPLSNGTVQINVSAAFQGQTATATITQTNVATAAQASTAGNVGNQGVAQAGGFPLKTVIFLGAAGAGAYVAHDLYQKYGPSSRSSCSSSVTPPSLIPAAGGTFDITVQESCPFRVSTDVPWITLSVSSAQVFEQTLTFTLTVAVNTGPARSGLISTLLADGTGGSAFGVNQAAGSLNSFRGTVAAIAASTYTGDAVCGQTLALSGVTALLTRMEAGISQGEVSVLEALTPAPGCPKSALPSIRRTYVLQSASVAGQTVLLRFLASTADAALPALSFTGTLSRDNRTITGLLTWHANNGNSTDLTAPLTLSVVEP